MPELGGDTPLDDILREIAELGFEGVELGGRFPRESAALAALLGGHGLDLIGGWYSGSLLERDADEEIRALQPHLSLLKALGASAFVFAETSNAVHGERGTPLDRSEEHTSALQSLMRMSYAVFCLNKKNKRTDNVPKQPIDVKTN